MSAILAPPQICTYAHRNVVASGFGTGMDTLHELAQQRICIPADVCPARQWPMFVDRALPITQKSAGNATIAIAIAIAGRAGNFQLNVMLPVIAYNLLQSISLLANAARSQADSALEVFTVNEQRIGEALNRNSILVTALNPVIGL